LKVYLDLSSSASIDMHAVFMTDKFRPIV